MSCFYTFPTRGTSVVIPADTAVFRYDAGGRTTEADNAFARIRRRYTRSGLLVEDALSIRTVASSTDGVSGTLEFPPGWGGGGEEEQQQVVTSGETISEAPSPGITDDFAHTYVIRYHYDLNGRRDSLYYPSNAPCVGACTKRQGYQYSPLTGALEQVSDLAGQTHSVAYDLRGRPWQTSSPGWLVNLDSNRDDQLTSHYSGLGNVQIGRDALGRMTSTWGSLSASSTYDGLGHLVGVNGVSPGTQYETYGYDAIGNRNYLQRVALTPTPGDNGVRHQVLDVNGKVHRVNSDPAQQYYYWLDQNYGYDAAGNADSEASREYVSASGSNKYWSTRSYYGADEKLRVFNRFAGLGPNSDASDRAHLGVYEEYWYDALGRRIQVRSRRDAGCNTFWPECPSVVNRFVWDGDQVLMERRVTGSDTDASWLDWGAPSTVAYAHMGGIDAPVAAFKDGVMVVPHANWRGEFVTGHAVIGTMPVINWPGQYEALDGAPNNPPTYVWFGDMLTGYTDGSGQKYMRNRYYDPVKGTFTQKDPIGLAGGLNLYGYAGGDAVNFSDPFGLTPVPLVTAGGFVLRNWRAVSIAGAIGFRGARVMKEARGIVSSPQMESLRNAAQHGQQVAVHIGQRTISYEPDLPASGMTWAGRGFHLGKEAFSSQAELTKTVLHELHRLD